MEKLIQYGDLNVIITIFLIFNYIFHRNAPTAHLPGANENQS